MCQKESWGAIFAITEAHSTQRDQPPRMHGPGLWMYEQKEQRVTPVRMIGVNCILWCPGWDGINRLCFMLNFSRKIDIYTAMVHPGTGLLIPRVGLGLRESYNITRHRHASPLSYQFNRTTYRPTYAHTFILMYRPIVMPYSASYMNSS